MDLSNCSNAVSFLMASRSLHDAEYGIWCVLFANVR
jgi:hypothetical protein